MSEVLREFSNLMMSIVQERNSLSNQLQEELEFRKSIEATVGQLQPEEMSPEMLVMKVAMLEERLRNLECIYRKCNGDSFFLLKELDIFRCEGIQEKANLTDKVKILEIQNQQM